MRTMKSMILSLSVLFIALNGQAQQVLTMEESIQLALKNNLQIKADEYTVKSVEQLKKTHTDIGKTNLTWMKGQYNSINKDNNISISQTIPFPTTIVQQVKLGEAQAEGARLNLSVTKNELVLQVSTLYLQLSYLKSLQHLLLAQDSLYKNFLRASELRYKTGESNLLEKTSAETQMLEIKNQITQNEAEISIYKTQLQTLLNSNDLIDIKEQPTPLTTPDTASSSLQRNPYLLFTKQETLINRQAKRVEQGRFLPDITVGYFSQSLTGYQLVGNDEIYFDKSKRFTGFQLGVSLPIWFLPQTARVQSARMAQAAAEKKYEYAQLSMNNSLTTAYKELEKNKISLDYYERSALSNAALILKQADKAFQSGEISYLEYLLSVKNAYAIRFNHLTSLNQYNQSVLRIRYLIGEI